MSVVGSSHLAPPKMTTPVLFVYLLAVLMLPNNIWTCCNSVVAKKFEFVRHLFLFVRKFSRHSAL